jgi:hypothetical protein
VTLAHERVPMTGRSPGTGGRASPLRLALTPVEAAAAIGCSRDFFDKHLLPELRVVRVGRKVFVAIRELEKWLDEHAALTLEAL